MDARLVHGFCFDNFQSNFVTNAKKGFSTAHVRSVAKRGCQGRVRALRRFYQGLRISSPAHHVTWHMVPRHFGEPHWQGQEQ